MADIFISYAREDEARIRDLVHGLEEKGWSIFWDRRIPPGKSWESYIGQALSEAKCVVVAWSHHSITSKWVKEEATDAEERGIIVPILLDAVKPPLGFRGIQAADMTDWKPGESSLHFNQLIQDIAAVAGGRHRPAPKEELTPNSFNKRQAQGGLEGPISLPESSQPALEPVWGMLIKACRTALRDLKDEKYRAVSFYVLFHELNIPDFEDLLDKWARLENDPKTQQIRSRFLELAELFNKEELSKEFRIQATKDIMTWKAYFEARLQR